MPGPHSGQLYAFALFVLAGMGLGLGLDLYRAARGVFRPGPVLTAAGDALFALGAGLFVVYTLWLATSGELRLYLLFGAALGLVLYVALASATVLPLFRVCWRAIAVVIRPIIRGCRVLLGLFSRAWQVLARLWPLSWQRSGAPDAPPEQPPNGTA